MKKVFLLLCLFLIVVVSSCSPEETETNDQNSKLKNEPTKATSVDPETVKPPTHG